MPILSTYQVKPGDTLGAIATRNKLPLARLLQVNQQISDPNLIQVGQLINIPSVAPSGQPLQLPGVVGIYDGVHPAPGTISTQRANLIAPPLTNAPGARDVAILDQLINQFAVGNNPRYLPGGGFTYCNIFVWDVTRAMGCELPHWLDAHGRPAQPFAPGAYEVNINGGVDWMKKYGVAQHGWQKLTDVQAQAYANAGQMALALWKNPSGGHGHTAVVRPGTLTARGPAAAQAGSRNFNMGHIKDGFGNLAVQYYGHV